MRSVSYPFLKGHPQRALAMHQMRGGGGVLSFEVDGTGEDARRFCREPPIIHARTEPGRSGFAGDPPVVTSHAMIRAEEREKMGVTEQMVRHFGGD